MGFDSFTKSWGECVDQGLFVSADISRSGTSGDSSAPSTGSFFAMIDNLKALTPNFQQLEKHPRQSKKLALLGVNCPGWFGEEGYVHGGASTATGRCPSTCMSWRNVNKRVFVYDVHCCSVISGSQMEGGMLPSYCRTNVALPCYTCCNGGIY